MSQGLDQSSPSSSSEEDPSSSLRNNDEYNPIVIIPKPSVRVGRAASLSSKTAEEAMEEIILDVAAVTPQTENNKKTCAIASAYTAAAASTSPTHHDKEDDNHQYQQQQWNKDHFSNRSQVDKMQIEAASENTTEEKWNFGRDAYPHHIHVGPSVGNPYEGRIPMRQEWHSSSPATAAACAHEVEMRETGTAAAPANAAIEQIHVLQNNPSYSTSTATKQQGGLLGLIQTLNAVIRSGGSGGGMDSSSEPACKNPEEEIEPYINNNSNNDPTGYRMNQMSYDDDRDILSTFGNEFCDRDVFGDGTICSELVEDYHSSGGGTVGTAAGFGVVVPQCKKCFTVCSLTVVLIVGAVAIISAIVLPDRGPRNEISSMNNSFSGKDEAYGSSPGEGEELYQQEQKDDNEYKSETWDGGGEEQGLGHQGQHGHGKRRPTKALLFLLAPASGSLAKLEDDDTVAGKALQWLMEEDPLHLIRDDTNLEDNKDPALNVQIIRRFVLATFFFSTGGSRRFNIDSEYLGDKAIHISNAGGEESVVDDDSDGGLDEEEGGSWTGVGWLTSKPECEWNGITCTGYAGAEAPIHGKITKIDLANSGLMGTLPFELHALSDMEDLILNNNALSGPLPSWIKSLTSLKTVYLNNNRFTGTIPVSAFSSLPALEELWLEGNSIEGEVSLNDCNNTQLGSLEIFTSDCMSPSHRVNCFCCTDCFP